MKKFIKIFLAACLLMVFALGVHAQSVGINATGDAPNSKAILDLSSTSKGFLPPRMTFLEKAAITSPPAGLMIWCTNCGTYGELQVYNGTIWTNLTGGAASGSVPGAPTIGTASAGNAQASVSFTAPVSNGGSTITSYTATSNPGNITKTLSQAGSGTITVTGLTNGTAYTFTVTATNANGTGAASAASNAVTPTFECGMVLTIYHVASGGVAPVNKTVSYGTVTGIPGEPTKCWITSNLGATRQALSVDDATEESSGWYWQFNRKQGYKMDNDGTTRTPNTTMVTSIDENSDWTVANDPCTLELGSGWRIPTRTEWESVANYWASSIPWNSNLKMHFAGCVGYDGLLYDRGVYGDYWSRSQAYATWGVDLWFKGTQTTQVSSFNKANGLSLRCLSE